MTHYPDLSRYGYGAARDESEADLEVGWLSADRSYPTRRPDDQFVSALLRCCLRPVRLCRGFHECDLGCNDPRQGLVCYDGREIGMGNGEIRVKGPDGQWYTAPTLVAHYVAAHSFDPPAPFVEGVMRRAREIHLLHGEALHRLQMLSVMDRYDLCLEALRALQAQHPNGLLADAIAALAAAKPALDSADDTSYKTELKRMSSVFATLRAGAADDDPTVAAVQPVKGFFVYVQHGEDYALKATLQLTAAVLERAHDAGLTGWRSDVRPSRFDEPS